MTQCLACGGTYEPIQDGMQYFHVCPPLSVAELTAAVTKGLVVLPIDPVTGLAETVAVAQLRRRYERANQRNENLVLHADNRPATIIAAGAGTVDELQAVDPARAAVVIVDTNAIAPLPAPVVIL